MRLVVIVLCTALIVVLASCASTTVDGHRVYGHIDAVSAADIRAALAADRAQSTWADKTVYHIEVISGDELRLYHTASTLNPSHDLLKRVRGKWRVVDTQIILNGQ